MLTFADSDLVGATPALHDYARKFFPLLDYHLWARPLAPYSPKLYDLGVPPLATPPPSLRLNRLVWPTGASRWAYGYFLAVSSQLEVILDRCHGSARDRNNPGLLRVGTTPGCEKVETQMYLLNPVKISGLDQTTAYEFDSPLGHLRAQAVYVLPLVDERYFWWQRFVRDVSIPQRESDTTDSDYIDPDSWSDLIHRLLKELGVPPAKRVHANADEEWISQHMIRGVWDNTWDYGYHPGWPLVSLLEVPIPVALDAICGSCDRRVVRQFDGTVHVQNHQAAYIALARSLVRTGRVSGGIYGRKKFHI
jgi:hypothetical protein